MNARKPPTRTPGASLRRSAGIAKACKVRTARIASSRVRRHLGEGGSDAPRPNPQTASDIVGFRVFSWPNAGNLWRVPEEDESLDEEGAIERLNLALELQYRSVLQ